MTAARRAAVFANLAVDLGTPLAQEDQLLLTPSPCGRPGQLLREDLGTLVRRILVQQHSSRSPVGWIQARDQAKAMSSGMAAPGSVPVASEGVGDDFGGPAGQLGPGGRLAATSCLLGWAAVASPRTAPAPTKEAAMSTWLWVLIIVVVLVLVFGVMRRRGR